MKFTPHGLGTGIGSVPHSDPAEAVEFVLKYFPEVPYWPQLPARGSSEGFLNQFLAPLVELGLVTVNGEKCYFDTAQDRWGEKLGRFYELYMAATEGDEQAIDFFRFREESASGFYALLRKLESDGTGQARYIKGQISGPITVGLAVTDQDRRAIYYNPQGRDVLIKTLALQGLNQARTLSRFGLPVIVFVDDPGLYASGDSNYITLNREEIISELNSIYDAIQGSGASAGTHSCAGMDWSILFDSRVDIVSFDAYNYFTTVSVYKPQLQNFLARGGVLAWGIVPTAAEQVAGVTTQVLGQKLSEHFDTLAGKGLERDRLVSQAMITPSCGTGTLPLEVAVKVHELVRAVADEVKKW